eukprot:8250010-Pyramimonas_sp.AAC.1
MGAKNKFPGPDIKDETSCVSTFCFSSHQRLSWRAWVKCPKHRAQAQKAGSCQNGLSPSCLRRRRRRRRRRTSVNPRVVND